jgi:hypothetical protein
VIIAGSASAAWKVVIWSGGREVLSKLSKLEWLGLAGGAVCLPASLFPQVGKLSDLLLTAGFAAAAAAVGSILKDWRWRTIKRRFGLDPHARVYVRRSATHYHELLRDTEAAAQVDVMGLSLAYLSEYLKDCPKEVMDKMKKPIRILLPGSRSLCDERDAMQGHNAGTLWRTLRSSLKLLNNLKSEYPSLFEVKYYCVHPYFAMTRIDDEIWVSLYVNRTGGSSPVIRVDRRSSEELFAVFQGYFEHIWKDSGLRPSN